MTTAMLHPDCASDELARVLRWRLTELLRAGYPFDVAQVLARRTDVDLHRAVDLVRRGCPPRLAYSILS